MNRIQHTLFTLLVVGLLASVTGCGILNDAPDASGSLDTTNTARLRIGPDGGQVVSADGRVRVIIPPGAMVTEEIININVTYSVPTGTLGEAYQISPTSLVFDQDVKVVFSYLGLGAEVPEALAVSGIFAGGWRALMPGGLDPQAYEVTGLTRNLGFFALVDLTGIQPLSPFAEACSGDGADCAPVCIDDILVSRLCERGESASQCGVSRQTDCVALGKACVAGACRVLECTDDVDCESGCASADTKVASRCVAGACEYEASTCPNGDCVGSACREQSCSADTDCAASCDGETVIYSTCGDSGFCSSTSTMPCAQLGRSCVGGECVDKDCHTDNDCGSWCVGGTVHRGVCSVDGVCSMVVTNCPDQGAVCSAGRCVLDECSSDVDCPMSCVDGVATVGSCIDGACQPLTAIDCALRGQVCNAGLCDWPATLECPADCAGCCVAGLCQDGDQAAACGLGGGSCEVCPETYVCEAGACSCVSDCETAGARQCAGPDQIVECVEVIRGATPCLRWTNVETCSELGTGQAVVCQAGVCHI